MTRTVITGGTVLLPDGRLADRDVSIAAGRIQAVSEPETDASPIGVDDTVDVIDARGLVVAPGFVDTHVHGGMGANFMTGDATSFATISRHLAAGGVTSCLAATASTGADDLHQALGRIAAQVGPLDGGIEVLGIHLEGPFLDATHRGVHRREHVRNPSAAELERLWEAAGSALHVVTLAPEIPAGLEAVAFFAERGVVVSLGHSGADYRQAQAAITAGVSRATHLWNGLPPLHHREPGPVLALVEAPSAFLEVVGDGRHVSPEMLRHTIRLAGRDRVVLVSDGTDVAGLADGTHHRWEGTEVVVSDGVSRTPDGDLAGSVVSMAGAVRCLVHRAQIPLADALVMAAQTPARSVGAALKGSLAAGSDADVVLLDPELDVVRTIARGRTIHQRED